MHQYETMNPHSEPIAKIRQQTIRKTTISAPNPNDIWRKDSKDIREHQYSTNNSRLSNTEMKISSKCLLEFNSSNAIDPLIKYWDDSTDCYSSPLRKTSGLSSSWIDRKYLLFQPDLGGWNNIRMSLEVTMLFALATGRILVLPPDAVLYLLVMNKNWNRNKGGVQDYVDMSRSQAGDGIEFMSMYDFLENVAVKGMLTKPFPVDKSTELIKGQELWDYLEQACYSRKWSPGKTFIGFNITTSNNGLPVFGKFTTRATINRVKEFSIGRTMLPYDDIMHQHRAIFFAGHNKNRMLTLYYGYFFFADPSIEGIMKRFVRDRIRYHDVVFSRASDVVKQVESAVNNLEFDRTRHKQYPIRGRYIAYHIRRGDFQHKHVKIPAKDILDLTLHLVPHHKDQVVYISTDEKDLSFFDPFFREFKAVYFLSNFTSSGLVNFDDVNQNYIGMIEQVICSGSDVFIGTPLSTFTAYISRIRGYMNSTTPGLYERTFYFMKNQMYQLHDKPHLALPFWPREFVEAFQGI